MAAPLTVTLTTASPLTVTRTVAAPLRVTYLLGRITYSDQIFQLFWIEIAFCHFLLIVCRICLSPLSLRSKDRHARTDARTDARSRLFKLRIIEITNQT